jgi:hypothetical protein
VVLKQQTIIHRFFYGNGNADHHTGQDFVVWKQITSKSKRVAFVKVWMSYILLRSCWCDITVLNVQAPTEDTCDDTRGSFPGELDQALSQFITFLSTSQPQNS